MEIRYHTLKTDMVKNYKEKLQIWFDECDKNNIDDLDEFDLENIANDFGIDISKYKKEAV